MAYLLQYDETVVVPYLRNLDLSREGRIVLAEALHRELRLYADVYINSPDRRLSPGSDCFRVDLIFRDPVRQVVHQLRLVLSDAAVSYGLLRVVYVEGLTQAPGL